MADTLTESLLEMHFFRAQVQHFTNIFGANFLRILKPSPQREAWVGFDQGWVHTSISEHDFYNHLEGAIQSQSSSVSHFYLGYFLQFKTVQKVMRKSKNIPKNYPIPYLRSELSLKPNKTTRLSQHETLLRLSHIKLASVCYACAMLFESWELYQDPDLDLLRCVDISTSPSGWATNQNHFITFTTETDQNPMWCSDPIEGKALGFKEWASPDSTIGPKKMEGEEVLNIIKRVNEEIQGRVGIPLRPLFKKSEYGTRFMPECFTIIEFGEGLGDRRNIRKIRIPSKEK